jgi:predicted Zn-dependent peptidase
MMRSKFLVIIAFVAVPIISATVPLAESADQIRLPRIERKSFLNGMQLLFLEGRGDSSPFLLMIEHGAAFDPVDKWGVTYLMTKMIVENLRERRYLEELESRGVELESRVEWDAIYFMGRSPTEELELTLLTLAEVLVRPEFTEATFRTARAELEEELTREEAAVESRTQALFLERVFQENPYGHGIKGTASTVANIQLHDVRIHARRLLLPNQAKLALSYSGNREQLFRRLSRRWGAWVRSEAAPFTFRQSSVPDRPQISVVEFPDLDHCLLRWGYLGVAKSSREYFVLKVLEQYVTLSLPDWARQVTNEDHIRGYVSMSARKMPGFVQVNVQVPVEAAVGFLGKLVESMDRIREGQVDEKRFEEARRLVLREFTESWQDPVERLLQVLRTDLYGVGVSFVSTFGLRLDRVTAEVFQSTLETVLPKDGFVLILASPSTEIASRLADFGEVEVLN